MRGPRRGSARAVAAAAIIAIDIFDWQEKIVVQIVGFVRCVGGLGVHGLVGIFCGFGVGVGVGVSGSRWLLARIRQHVDAHDAALVLAAPIVLLRGAIDRLGAVREQLIRANCAEEVRGYARHSALGLLQRRARQLRLSARIRTHAGTCGTADRAKATREERGASATRHRACLELERGPALAFAVGVG
ncbi:hypothetical protein EDB84DRAFT_476142 [Lactarius hengduanensis]|nr:hypothetical protein EDB84DRAFT_476142 [Lactarius hengduanensis]